MPPNAVTSAASVSDTYPIPLDEGALPATWDAAWLSLGRTAPTGLLPELMAAWSEPHRHYHDQRHLGECMALWTRWRAHCNRAGEVAIALWFHDAIYDPRDAGNELNSAGWAARSLTHAGADSDTVQRVHDLVMATHRGAPAATVFEQDGSHPEGLNVDARLLVDIDLAILGSPAERFERYDQDVRKEYAWVQGFRYQEARAQVLRSLLDRPRLYQTEAAVALLERPARTNLAAALSRLAQ
jgi:predicted metal-dependent HD superfamily phosphohydrolase